ncbi:LSU ribosomal protein L25P [Magnetococcus marinus MC-1]|uniref:Large ribosomal subunit protein bL25 n=1 Tax=Magnetococcus marinus (strain ATCC BAA-1437 / JCM 17883 / MC-1) TaxID=156889 RepID=A0L5U7_MAGMM|nr:50S ribosomal protein L25/general stress protein Ctc [Magnetococcus marinus]ABK43340.1 LSU ribosomal protein L25P [Magnetococcus marinus MC-1]
MATFETVTREGLGKGVARKLRQQGRIPAVVYGAGKENISLEMNLNAFRVAIAGQGPTLFNTVHQLSVDGKVENVLVRGVQRHPVTDLPEHVDFLRLDPTKMITVHVPVHLRNEDQAPGLKRGGIIQIVRHELEIHCLSGNIPTEILVDCAEMEIGKSIHIEDITLPEGTKVFTDVNFTVVVMVGVKVEETDEEAGAEA